MKPNTNASSRLKKFSDKTEVARVAEPGGTKPIHTQTLFVRNIMAFARYI